MLYLKDSIFHEWYGKERIAGSFCAILHDTLNCLYYDLYNKKMHGYVKDNYTIEDYENEIDNVKYYLSRLKNLDSVSDFDKLIDDVTLFHDTSIIIKPIFGKIQRCEEPNIGDELIKQGWYIDLYKEPSSFSDKEVITLCRRV